MSNSPAIWRTHQSRIIYISLLDEASLIASDDEPRDQLAPHAAILIIFIIYLLEKHIITWFIDGDQRTIALINYLQFMYAYEHIMSIQDPPEILSIILFYDADFAGDIQSRRSTSDYILN